MKYYPRYLDLKSLVSHKSLFVLGPRQTGKSTLLKTLFPDERYIDLLEADTFRELSRNPELLRQRLRPEERIIIIDEIQKLPMLLDEIQALIDRNKELRFVLTGSSARKLKRGSTANLLAGRAWVVALHPLVSYELNADQLTNTQLIKLLNVGGLPGMYDSPYPEEDLKAYVGTYLQEEIRAEGLARSIENFSRFLDVAGLCHGEQVNYTRVAADAQVPPRTVREYFQLLEDTLIGYQLPSFKETKKRKPVATPKFYFFDIGVANTLLRRKHIEPRSEAFGKSLEHLIYTEMKVYLDYRRLDSDLLTYWRSTIGQEVDFVIGDEIAIEVKSTAHIELQQVKGLICLGEEIALKKKIVVAMEKEERRIDHDIQVMPTTLFLKRLWDGDIID